MVASYATCLIYHFSQSLIFEAHTLLLLLASGKSVFGQSMNPFLFFQRSEKRREQVVALQRCRRSNYDQLRFCPRKGDVYPSPIVEQVTNIFIRLVQWLHQRNDDAILISSLVLRKMQQAFNFLRCFSADAQTSPHPSLAQLQPPLQ